MTDDIVIIGGGIIGIAAAAVLAGQGRSPLVIDPDGICEGTSSGNAGAFAFTDVLPLAHKGMLKNLPGWLTDPLGPLSIPPAYLPSLMPWFVRFLAAGRPGRYEASLSAQASMMTLASREWMGLMDRSGTRSLLREEGCLELYESEAELKAAQPGWEARARHGVAFETARASRLAELQPGLSDRFAAGVFVPGWKTVADPKMLGKAVWAHAQKLGARHLARKAVRLESTPDGAAVHLDNGETRTAKTVILAAGAWSHLLARPLGDSIPLETERGYNTTLPIGSFDVRRQLVFSRHGFVVTPLDTGLRIGGAVELGGLKRPPNHARTRAMLEKTKLFLPGLKTDGGTQWMGYRPSLPDSLPVIGRSRSSANVLYAFGHGHLGLTQAAATARLLAALVSGDTPPIDMTPFSPQRF